MLNVLPTRRVVFIFLVTPMLGLTLVLLTLFACIDFERGRLEYPENVLYLDRESRVLRFFPDEKGERHLWADMDEIPERLKQAFLAAEDERFFQHQGFDPQAIMRAAYSNIRNGRVVSGASTLSQQLVRILYPSRRTYQTKIGEIVRAVQLERQVSKEDIFEHYLNRVPMGNNLVGVKLAAQVYFGKGIEQLTISECALLAALPKAPGRLNPYRHETNRLLERRNWVLDRMQALGFLSGTERERAREVSIETVEKWFPMETPHLVDMLLRREQPNRSNVGTTIDLTLQHRVEEIVHSHRYRLGYRGAKQAVAMVVRNDSQEVLALVGSVEYGEKDGGYNNGTLAERSPGSALKPFLYGLAIENGYPASTVLEDTKRWYKTPLGDYLPLNYERREYGPVTMRTALGNSLNLAAVTMIRRVGISNFYDFLMRIGLLRESGRGPDEYGVGLAIGNPEVTLEGLVTGYMMLANGGYYRKLRYLQSEEETGSTPALSPEAAFVVTDILSDPTARALSFGSCAELDFPYRVAWKTGTSTSYRDCWTVGYTPEYTVGVWVGNFEGNPTFNLSGSTGAGPIFADIIRTLYRDGSPSQFHPPTGLVREDICAHSGEKQSENCSHCKPEWFLAGTAPQQVCQYHREKHTKQELPTAYAGWLHDRENRGIDAIYSLVGTDRSRRNMGVGRDDQRLDSECAAEGRVRIGSGVDREVIVVFNSDAPVEILYPLDGDRFLTDRAVGEESIRLRAQVLTPTESIIWYVDGVQYAEAPPPYEATWVLKRGMHRIAVSAGSSAGDEIEVFVE